ncbi:39S mitochondrial ribosomal protein L46-domain-containing protein [Sporodiniella umbellata]|nr:39S mitochondrial ribosomal protein L46-domain-containing protein [Sporodiniella umbellata]
MLLKRGLATAVANPLLVRNQRIQASVVLSRAPQITRDATDFEKAYFDYREKFEREQSSTTPSDFYFKKGSVAERRWKHDEKARQEAMKQDESLTESLKKANVTDKTNNQKKLDRALQKTLYLVIKSADQWQFPQGPLDTTEYLHEAAERTLKETCGADLDTWFVGRQPIAFHKVVAPKEETGMKVFFMKARIYAGQVQPGKDVADFAWLTKEELADRLAPEYYKSIKNSLSEI